MSLEQFRHDPPPSEKDKEAVPILKEDEIQNFENFVIQENIPEDQTEEMERATRSVEQTMLRNNVFFVHTINMHPELRHNENSNVSKEATFEDDLDILLAFEPSISSSSVMPGADEEGMVSGLWSHSGGVLLRGGEISAASINDSGTVSKGIRERSTYGGFEGSADEIDEVVQAPRSVRPDEIGGYNEIVIDNPEVFGYFSPGEMDHEGGFWAYGIIIRKNLERLHELYKRSPNGYEYRDELELFQRNVNKYQNRFNQIKERNLPFYVMAPDRRFFEVLQVNENGSLSVGAELTPEQVVQGAAVGLSSEDRKERGRQLITKGVFRDPNTQQEALDIIEKL